MKLLLGELWRYTIVGGAGFVVDFFFLYALTEWSGFHYLISATVGFCAGLVINYVFCIYWVFRHRAFGSARIEFAIFMAVGLGGLLLNDVFLAICTPLLDGNYMVAKMGAVGFVFLWNFFMRRQLLFVQRKQSSLESMKTNKSI